MTHKEMITACIEDQVAHGIVKPERKEFGAAAVDHYQHRILERMEAGHIYKNPLKTIWLWAMEDRRTGQGFWTTYRGHTCRRKKYGGS